MTESVSFEVVSSIQNSIDASQLDFSSDSEIEYSLSSSVPISATSLATLPGESDTPINEPETPLENKISHIDKNKEHIEMCETITPINDSGIVLENDLSVIDTDEENKEHSSELIMNSKAPSSKKVQKLFKKSKYQKPLRPCFFCKKHQSRLKHHILGKHKDEPLVRPLLKLSDKGQDHQIALMRKQGIRDYNMELLKRNETDFMRER